MPYYGVSRLKSANELPSALRGGIVPQYVHPSVKCPECAYGYLRVDYTYDERQLVCNDCPNFAVVARIGRYGLVTA